MNQKTASNLKKVSIILDGNFNQLKKYWNTLDAKTKNLAMRDYKQIIKQYDMKQKIEKAKDAISKSSRKTK